MFRIRTAFDKAGSQLTLHTITQKLSQKISKNLQKIQKRKLSQSTKKNKTTRGKKRRSIRGPS